MSPERRIALIAGEAWQLVAGWTTDGRGAGFAPRSRWMRDPDGLLRASCSADALMNVYLRLRRGSLPPARGLKMLREMLHGLSPLDIAKGAAMLRRLPS